MKDYEKDESITFKANYERPSYSITYNLDGGIANGELISKTKAIIAGVATKLKGNFTKTAGPKIRQIKQNREVKKDEKNR